MGTILRKHLVSILYPALVLISLQTITHAQGIVATHTSDGRLVYENGPADTPETASSASVDSGLVYWSNREHRWKPIPAMNSHSMRAAKSAAEEVRRQIRRAARKDPSFATQGGTLKLASAQGTNSPAAASQLIAATNQNVLMAKAIAATTMPKRQVASFEPQTPAWINDLVEQAAVRHSVDPSLVRAIVQVESNFNPHAVSRKGAIGLMQLMPRTAKSLNVTNPYDPAQNVDAGVRHFKQLLDSYGGNLELSLAAYNAGVTAVHRSGGVPNYSETRNYVKRITGIYGSNTARLTANGHPPLEIKRDAQGHLSVSDID